MLNLNHVNVTDLKLTLNTHHANKLWSKERQTAAFGYQAGTLSDDPDSVVANTNQKLTKQYVISFLNFLILIL